MRAIGYLLLVSGWFIVAAALGLLTQAGQRLAFVGAGMAVEALGLGLVAHGYREMERER